MATATATDIRKETATERRSRRPIFVNCRIESGSVTGVHRYLAELREILGDRLTPIRPSVPVRGVGGHAWEQFALPIKARGLLWSPSNTGPIGDRNQVVTIHDVASLDHPEWFKPSFARWYRWMTPRLVRNVRKVITVSAFSKDRIVHHSGVDPDRVVVIPNGVSRRFRPPNALESAILKLRYPSLRRDFILSVGSLEPRKNLGRLFSAWESIRRSIPDVSLVVAGVAGRVFSGTGYGPPPTGVEFLGKVADEDLPTLYGNALALVYPSLYEGFGLPPLEAMACGTPAIVADAASMPELVGEAALKVDPLDIGSIAEGISRIIEDSTLRETLSRLGLDRASEFTWERAAARTGAVLIRAAETPLSEE